MPEEETLKDAAGIADENTGVYMDVDNNNEDVEEQVKEQIKQDLEGELSEFEPVSAFDILVYSLEFDENDIAIEESRTNVTQLNSAVGIVLETPKEEGAVYQVVRAHENEKGETEFTLLDTQDNGDGTVFIETDRFSRYYLVNVAKPARRPGDVNDDGQVSLMDLVRLCKYLAGYQVEIDEANSDVNGDGQVTLMDLVRLCKHLAGYDVVLE